MHVDRHRNVGTVVLHDLAHLLGQHFVPAFGLGGVIEIGEQAEFAPLLDVRALDLCGGRRVAGNGAGLQYGHGSLATTAGDGEVLPGMAFLLDQLLQGVGGALLATGSPPVQNFDLAGMGEQWQGKGNGKSETMDRVHVEAPSCFYPASHGRLRWTESMRREMDTG